MQLSIGGTPIAFAKECSINVDAIGDKIDSPSWSEVEVTGKSWDVTCEVFHDRNTLIKRKKAPQYEKSPYCESILWWKFRIPRKTKKSLAKMVTKRRADGFEVTIQRKVNRTKQRNRFIRYCCQRGIELSPFTIPLDNGKTCTIEYEFVDGE